MGRENPYLRANLLWSFREKKQKRQGGGKGGEGRLPREKVFRPVETEYWDQPVREISRKGHLGKRKEVKIKNRMPPSGGGRGEGWTREVPSSG